MFASVDQGRHIELYAVSFSQDETVQLYRIAPREWIRAKTLSVVISFFYKKPNDKAALFHSRGRQD